jgi:hypothetical protein
VGRKGLGQQSERQTANAAQCATRVHSGLGHRRPQAKTVFLYFFTEYNFNSFLSNFGQISYSFFIQNYPTKFYLEN